MSQTHQPTLIDLLHRASQACEDAYARVSRTSATPRQRAVLAAIAAIAAHADKPSQTDIVGITGVDRSTLADIVRRLVHKGLVVRVRSRADHRTYQLRLTPGGEQELALANEAAAMAAEQLANRLPVKARAAFLSALVKLAAPDDNGEAAQRAA